MSTPLLLSSFPVQVVPEPYIYGSRGPESSDILAKKHGYVTANKLDPVTGRWALMDEHRAGSAGKHGPVPGALTGMGLDKVAEGKE